MKVLSRRKPKLLHFGEFKSNIWAMKCEMCGRDPELIVLLPKKQPGGKLNTFACKGCSIESGMYCQKHQRPHMGFNDETTACMLCIEDIVERDGERIAGIFAAAVSQSDKASEIQQAIQNWLERINSILPSVSLSELPLVVRFLETPHALNIARAVVTYSQRMRITPEEVIKRVAKDGAGVILPPESIEEI